jgi:hypothetical protein
MAISTMNKLKIGPPHPRRAKISEYGWAGQSLNQFFLIWSHKTQTDHLLPTDWDYLNFLDLESSPQVASFDFRTFQLVDRYGIPKGSALPDVIVRLRNGYYQWRKLIRQGQIETGLMATQTFHSIADKHNIQVVAVAIEDLVRESCRLRNVARLLACATRVKQLGYLSERETIIALFQKEHSVTVEEILTLANFDLARVNGAIAQLFIEGVIDGDLSRNPISRSTQFTFIEQS